ncbi:PilW family protein [Schlegelella sp. S2-27]|uniref:PilW family protein n=1 Tax=Caldimonas mangrovi TaxID=2944811 RepID=A0ABT0YLP9_9BURK|nr:PilW family protein [Caldimonas mangrovi]MCM5679658.1 PilW family protein [Caldimonas mangrovi]
MSKPVPVSLLRRSAGRSLLEILVSLAIAAVILGAILIAVSGTGLSGRKHDAQSRLTDEGQIAMSLVTQHLRMAGFWQPDSAVPSLDTSAGMLFGCRDGFSNPDVADVASLACGGGGDNDAIVVRYDGTQPGGVVRDCLGATAVPAGAWVDNRFYVAVSPATGNPALYCRGNGGGGPEVLVDNVESMRIRYGVAAVNNDIPSGPTLFDPPAFTGESVRYLEADELAACTVGSLAANSWCAVTSVRLCLVLRTDDNAADQAGTPYIDCDGNTATQADQRIRRAMVTTISLRNRTSVVNP